MSTLLTQLATKTQDVLAIRTAGWGDYRQISNLLTRYSLEAKPFDAWQELWIGNPAYQKKSSEWPIGWVLETGNREIVGYLGNIPLHFQLKGQTLLAAVTHGWVVEVSHRAYSPLLLDSYFTQRNIDLFLSTTVNAQASEAFSSFGSLRVPAGVWDRSLFWVAHYRRFARSWAAAKALPLPNLLSYPLSLAARLKDYGARKAVRKLRRDDALQWSTGFDEQFDTFWQASSQKDSDLLQFVRTREVLEWHFGRALREGKAWLLIKSRNSALLSYAIFLRQDNPKYGLERLRLVDCQSLEEDPTYLQVAIASALERCKKQGIHMLEYVGPSDEIAKDLECLSPCVRALPCWSYFYRASRPAMCQHLAGPNAWRPSLFDGDSSL